MFKNRISYKEKANITVFALFVGGLFILNLIIPNPTVLVAERRIPAKFPELNTNTILSGSFMGKFDEYAADNFVFRDVFRGINSFMVFDLLMQGDISGLYRNKTIGLGEFRKTEASSFRASVEKISTVAEQLQSYNMNVYFSLIPDKSIYAEYYMPGFDLELAEKILAEVLDELVYIPISPLLSGADYYMTDLHWDQSKIAPIAEHIAKSMGMPQQRNVYIDSLAGEFHGLYAGQLALPVSFDNMSFVTDINLNSGDTQMILDLSTIKVSYLNEKTLEFEPGPMYDLERLKSIDPYDFFLRGPQPLIILENESAPNKELYLFRDSFGSSFAPLLTPYYAKIYVIDLRYMNFQLLDMFINFTQNSDVLFLYGSQILNNPSVLQIS